MFADKPINGSPFCPKITGEGKQRSAISVSGSSEIKLKINETFSKEDKLVATIITPSGSEENCYLKRIAETGHLLVSFTPEQSGEHLIIVTKNGQPVFGSPFKINVLPTEIGNAALVKLTGTGHKYGKTMVENTFNIDTRQAGYGAVSLSIEGPSKCEISSTEVEPGLLKITYKTKTPGYYLMNLKFADQHVTGSPFTIEVTGSSEQFQRETQQLQTRSVEEQQIGSVCKMSFTITQTLSKQKLKAFVTSPSGKRVEANLKQVNQTTHVVEWTAVEIGEHTIEIVEETTNKNIPGFPIKYQVGKPKEAGGVGAVGAVGPGLQGGVVGQKGKHRNGQLVKLYEVQFTMSYYTHALDVNNNSFANYPSDRFDTTSSPFTNAHNAYPQRYDYSPSPLSYASSYARAKSIENLPHNSPHRLYSNHQSPTNDHPSFSPHHNFQQSSSSSQFNEFARSSNGDFSQHSLYAKSTSNLNTNLNEKERRRRYFLFSEN